ncbi:carboxypeptidase M32 [Legionella sp. W05-934-2]|uniref:carboxypeptidase M32 n=1 Tax=Legionella sp. W05-934-2 TaxID=1198649 RepID=UPI003463730F
MSATKPIKNLSCPSSFSFEYTLIEWFYFDELSMQAYKELEQLFDNIAHLNHLDAIIGWDEAVMMPPGGAKKRGEAMAYLRGLKHTMLTTNKVAELLNQCQVESLKAPWQSANYLWMKRQYQRACAVPNDLVKRLSIASVQCEQAWRVLRPKNDWQQFKPLLQTVFDLSYESSLYKADALGLDIYDQCLDEFSPGCSQALITPIFDQLRSVLPPLIQATVAKQRMDNYQPITGHYPIEKQRQLSRELMAIIGFDFNHGRFDVSHHPFCGGVADDVRITTRFKESDFTSAIMGVCHETGHAMYELGLPREWLSQPVGLALGMAVHESQSLLVEMQVCRSQDFLKVLMPKLKHYFGESDVLSFENLSMHYTRVKPDYIRVDADEMTYPLHVILRYEIEKALFAKDITIDDLPSIWHEKMQQYLGLSTQGNYQNGVMQDVHWPCGLFGYFPAYTLGALIAAQLYSAALKQQPSIPSAISEGNFVPLMTWLRKHIHSKACSEDFQTLLKEATGEGLNPHHYITHIKKRYGVS